MLSSEKLRARMARDDLAALVDFLKNHPPPPDNFMSMPYEQGEEARGRWFHMKTLRGRSKSVPKAPQQIRLPDSAVAGVTTGGHRHIAISIPLEATPYGNKTRSQYPVCSLEAQVSMTSKETVRTYKNEKGVVTVLRPVTEVFESDSSATAAKHPSTPYAHANSHGQKPPPLPPHKPTGNAGLPLHDYIGALPMRFGAPLLDDSNAPWHTPRAPSRCGSSASNKPSSTVFKRSEYPPRASSMVAGRSTKQSSSIDGVISASEPSSHTPIVSRGRYFSDPLGAELRKQTSSDELESVMAGDGSHSMGPTSIRNSCSSQMQITTLIAESPSLSQDGHSGPPTPNSIRSRKDMVREKKRRDLEAMWKAKVKEEHNRKVGELAKTVQPPRQPNEEPAVSVTVTGPTLAMSNLMVVMDMSPDVAEEQTQSLSLSLSTSGDVSKDGSHSPPSLIAVNESNMPTPPSSPHGSPRQRHSAADRTSLTRRREWKAMRERERTAREAVLLAKAKADSLAPGGVAMEDGAASQSDHDVLRLYEAYREHRLRDMERRLRRLEKNGDVWLKALVPVLQSMDRRMAGADQTSKKERLDWSLDDETPPVDGRKSRLVDEDGMTGASGPSRHALLDKLMRRDGSDDTSSDGMTRSGDVSGLDTIEPIMRELARGARCRPIMTKPPVVTNGRFNAT